MVDPDKAGQIADAAEITLLVENQASGFDGHGYWPGLRNRCGLKLSVIHFLLLWQLVFHIESQRVPSGGTGR